jgi:hypothetical protein
MEADVMKWMGTYLVGYIIVLGGLTAALWKLGIVERVGSAWMAIGIAVAIGIGIMISVSSSGEKKVLEIDERR